ncbi:CHAD domain-containing protein [Allosaccharopolyspora coralli]|uniref:CHAD domain-containing protein n=1 Tax=Allosaccharopolyspora coralli TaxID=2665642 RepID=A0A5Q3Q2Q3_9PSEU|nr:CHAD domain-containing protein [Allosaccharopolyspora coralli]QGK68861.1 CHAD domain-containing protein [Allosaccharopolyspora coralli]
MTSERAALDESDTATVASRVEDLGQSLPTQVHAPSDAPVHEHVRAALDHRTRRLLEHDPGTRSGEDPEDLHQMRVAVRRMRAVLKAGGPFLDASFAEPLRADLGELGRALGPVRDLDVMSAQLRAQAAGLPVEDQRAADRLLQGFDAEHDSARRELLSVLDSQGYLDLLHRLVAALNTPLPHQDSDVDGSETLRTLAAKQFRTLRKEIRALDTEPADDALHAIRIRVKRLRYTGELATPISGKPVRRVVKAAARLQDVIGDHQDACVAIERLRTLVTELGDEACPDVALAAGRLVEREHRRRLAQRDLWPGAWRKLRKRGEAL